MRCKSRKSSWKIPVIYFRFPVYVIMQHLVYSDDEYWELQSSLDSVINFMKI